MSRVVELRPYWHVGRYDLSAREVTQPSLKRCTALCRSVRPTTPAVRRTFKLRVLYPNLNEGECFTRTPLDLALLVQIRAECPSIMHRDLVHIHCLISSNSLK